MSSWVAAMDAKAGMVHLFALVHVMGRVQGHYPTCVRAHAAAPRCEVPTMPAALSSAARPARNLRDRYYHVQIWINVADTLLSLLVTKLLSPRVAQRYRAEILYEGPWLTRPRRRSEPATRPARG